MNSDVILENITNAIHRQDPKAQAFLFGSRARGDNKTVTSEIENRFRDVLYNIELESGQIISVFIYPISFWNNTLKYSPLY